MLGISPHIRVLHPSLAEQIRVGGPVNLPGELGLWMAGYLGLGAQLTGPMLTGLTDGTSRSIQTLASFTFRPLSWALATIDDSALLAEAGWTDVSEWLRYEDDRDNLDLRLLNSRLVVVREILHALSDDKMQLFSSEIAPIVLGRLPE